MTGENIFITYTGYTDLYVWSFFFIISVAFFILSQTKLKSARVYSVLSFLITPALVWGSLGIAKLGYNQYSMNTTTVIINNTTTISSEIFTYSPTYEVMASTWITMIAIAFAIISLLNVFGALINAADENMGISSKNPQHIITPNSKMWEVGEQKTADVSNRANVEDFQVKRMGKL